MADQYLYLIVEPDWDSDGVLEATAGTDGTAGDAINEEFPEFGVFEKLVEELGATIVGGNALHNAKHGGRVTPGPAGRLEEEAVYTDGASPEATEVISGYYLLEVPDEATARKLAAHVPTGGHVEWRKVFPMG